MYVHGFCYVHACLLIKGKPYQNVIYVGIFFIQWNCWKSTFIQRHKFTTWSFKHCHDTLTLIYFWDSKIYEIGWFKFHHLLHVYLHSLLNFLIFNFASTWETITFKQKKNSEILSTIVLIKMRKSLFHYSNNLPCKSIWYVRSVCILKLKRTCYYVIVLKTNKI